MDVQVFLTNLLVMVWSYAGVKVIVTHTLINVVVALWAARKEGDIKLSRLTGFIMDKLLPYVTIYFAVKLLGQDAGLDYLAAPVWVIIEASLVGDLGDNMVKLGLPIPEGLARLIVKT